MSKPYVMPEPFLGQVVWWYPQGDTRPENGVRPAIVQNVSKDGLALLVMHIGSPNFIPKDGVRHVNDPRMKESPMPEFVKRGGGWAFPEEIPVVHAKEAPLATQIEALAASAKASPLPEAAPRGELIPDNDEVLDVLAMKHTKSMHINAIAPRMGKQWKASDVKAILNKFTKEQALSFLGEHGRLEIPVGVDE